MSLGVRTIQYNTIKNPMVLILGLKIPYNVYYNTVYCSGVHKPTTITLKSCSCTSDRNTKFCGECGLLITDIVKTTIRAPANAFKLVSNDDTANTINGYKLFINYPNPKYTYIVLDEHDESIIIDNAPFDIPRLSSTLRGLYRPEYFGVHFLEDY